MLPYDLYWLIAGVYPSAHNIFKLTIVLDIL